MHGRTHARTHGRMRARARGRAIDTAIHNFHYLRGDVQNSLWDDLSIVHRNEYVWLECARRLLETRHRACNTTPLLDAQPAEGRCAPAMCTSHPKFCAASISDTSPLETTSCVDCSRKCLRSRRSSRVSHEPRGQAERRAYEQDGMPAADQRPQGIQPCIAVGTEKRLHRGLRPRSSVGE